MAFDSPLDLYCERTGPGLWAEPLNALSNAAFFVALFFAARRARRLGVLDGESVLLLVLLAAIGTGSALFHTFAVRWAAVADSAPIFLFQLVYLAVYGRRVIGLSPARTALLAGAFVAATLLGAAMLPPGLFNGSVSYLPAWLFLAGLAVYHFAAGKTAPCMLPIAAGLLTVSLAVRSVDLALCPALPAGVHFMWHILNGAVLYCALAALFANRKGFSR